MNRQNRKAALLGAVFFFALFSGANMSTGARTAGTAIAELAATVSLSVFCAFCAL